MLSACLFCSNPLCNPPFWQHGCIGHRPRHSDSIWCESGYEP